MIVYQLDVSLDWLSFIQKQSNLKILKIIWAYGNSWKLSYIAEIELMKLESFSANGVRISASEMEKFIEYVEKWDNLNRIHVEYAEISLMNDVYNGKYTNWSIDTKNVSINNMEITFKRKK